MEPEHIPEFILLCVMPAPLSQNDPQFGVFVSGLLGHMTKTCRAHMDTVQIPALGSLQHPSLVPLKSSSKSACIWESSCVPGGV